MYYISSMKVSKTFRLSEEAVRVLDAQVNATEFLESLILTGPPETQISTGLSEQRVREIIREELASKPVSIDSLGLKPASEFVPRPPDPKTGYPCCSRQSPCKHWQFDQNEVVWVNSLTGARRELDG